MNDGIAAVNKAHGDATSRVWDGYPKNVFRVVDSHVNFLRLVVKEKIQNIHFAGGKEMLHPELQRYKEMSNHPSWRLMYKLKWSQLADIIELKNLRILDFGSGGGTTANYLAKNNEVIAIEPREDMIEDRERENTYTQIQGKMET